MLWKCNFLQPIIFSIILGAAWLVRSVNISSKSQRHSVVLRSRCRILHSNDHYYLKSSCEEMSSQCQLTANDTVEGNGTVVSIKCKHGMSIALDFAVCFDGKWYPSDHTCIRLSSTCGLATPFFTNRKLKEKDDSVTASWHAEILEHNKMDNSNKTLCGGTLITPKIVLTAYSCVTEGERKRKKDPKKLLVGLGITSRRESHFDQVLRVQQVSEGPRFAVLPAVEFRKLEKISILKLDSPAEISYDVMPACFDSSILGPQTGYSFLSGVVVGLNKSMTEELPGQANNKFSDNVLRLESTASEADQKIETFKVSITDQSAMHEDEVSVFTTSLINLQYFGSGFIVEVSGRYYILGVYVGNYYEEQGSSVFNKVYFGSIGKTIKQYIEENQ